MGRTLTTMIILLVYTDEVRLLDQSYLSLEDLTVNMVVRAVLPSFNTTPIDMRRKPKVFIARRTDLDTVTVSEGYREIN